jgi:hypothetical protein
MQIIYCINLLSFNNYKKENYFGDSRIKKMLTLIMFVLYNFSIMMKQRRNIK